MQSAVLHRFIMPFDWSKPPLSPTLCGMRCQLFCMRSAVLYRVVVPYLGIVPCDWSNPPLSSTLCAACGFSCFVCGVQYCTEVLCRLIGPSHHCPPHCAACGFSCLVCGGVVTLNWPKPPLSTTLNGVQFQLFELCSVLATV